MVISKMHPKNNIPDKCTELVRFMGYDSAKTFGLIVKEIVELQGHEGLKVLEKAMIEKGRIAAKKMKSSGAKINSFMDFGRLYGMSQQGITNSIISPTKMEIISPNEVVLVHTSCTKYNAWCSLGLSDELIKETCRIYFLATEILFKELFPDAQMTKERLLPNGDQTCNIRFKR